MGDPGSGEIFKTLGHWFNRKHLPVPESGPDNEYQSTLKEIYDPELLTFGHATNSPDKARQILSQGLYVARLPFSSYTIARLINPDLPLESQQQTVIDEIKNWKHHGRMTFTHMLVVQLPRPPGKNIDTEYIESFLTKLPHYQMVKGESELFYHVLSAQYIRGSIDVKTGHFTANPTFNPVNKN
jgi:hypothetical protein